MAWFLFIIIKLMIYKYIYNYNYININLYNKVIRNIMKVTHIYAKIGIFVSLNQILCVIVCFVITLIMGIGILRIKIISEP